MSLCKYKRIEAVKLCLADLVHLVEIQTRELSGNDYDDSQPVETFTTIRSQWCAIETVSTVTTVHAMFAKINIVDGATHIFWMQYDSGLPDFETRNHWILYDGRRFKILKSDNINELNTTVAVQTVERGDSSLEAVQA